MKHKAKKTLMVAAVMDRYVNSFMNVKNLNIFYINCVFQEAKPKFIPWFKENRAELSKKNPELKPGELTKHAMNLFNSIYPKTDSSESNGETNKTAKRKINEENGHETSGIAKLAKFAKQ